MTIEFLRALQTKPGSVVIVDDHFGDPALTHLYPEDLTRFHEYLSEDEGALNRVRTWLELKSEATASDIVTVAEEKATALWGRFRSGDASAQRDLAPLFETVALTHDGETQKLGVLVAFCQRELGVEPLTFSSLNAAGDALKHCMLLYVDFYLEAGLNPEATTTAHAAFKASYRNGFEHDGATWPKMVVLVSSKLPDQDQLQRFRGDTGIRSAFFSSLRKGDVSAETLSRHLFQRAERYEAAAKLSQYLDAMSGAVDSAAQALITDVERLELHDLALLDALKLSAEQESLQTYLTWILSEALASKLRLVPALQSYLLPKEEALRMLDGKLLPASVLFELFSDIAILPVSPQDDRANFGDVYATVGEGGQATEALALVISPACDLLRCSADYDVICVRGQIEKIDARLERLLVKNSLFGKGSHVIRYRDNGKSTYAHITWQLKRGIFTVPAKTLADPSKFKRLARLSELFAQEVKELAFGDASRIGIPVDPVFVVVGKVVVRLNFLRGQNEEPIASGHDLSDREFISAVITKGRVEGSGKAAETTIVFTQQFCDWLTAELFPSVMTDPVPEKLKTVQRFFAHWKTWHVTLNNRSKTECEGALLFRYDDAPGPAAGPTNKMEILVSPL